MTLINNFEGPENHPTLNILENGLLQIYPETSYTLLVVQLLLLKEDEVHKKCV